MHRHAGFPEHLHLPDQYVINSLMRRCEFIETRGDILENYCVELAPSSMKAKLGHQESHTPGAYSRILKGYSKMSRRTNRSRYRRAAAGFVTEHSGSVAPIFAVCLPLLVGTVGLCLDYGIASHAHQTMQLAADAGALAGARELSLSDAKRDNVPAVVKAVVESYVTVDSKGSGAENAALSTVVQDSPLQIIATLEKSINRQFGGLFGMDAMRVQVTSIAQVMGMPNICLLALERSELDALKVDKKSFLEGKSCAIFSNSISAKGVVVKGSAILRASTICSAGGVDANSSGDIAPPPFTDCPQFEDPLGARQEPSVGGCTFKDTVIKNQVRTINPGVYCGGLKIDGQSSITVSPGLYTITKGNLEIKGHSVLKGRDVSFHLDADAKLKVEEKTAIELEARTDGALTGILFFGSRKQTSKMEHEISQPVCPEAGRYALFSFECARCRFRIWTGGQCWQRRGLYGDRRQASRRAQQIRGDAEHRL